MRMRHIVICGFPALQYFSTLSQNGTVFEKKVTEHKKCALNFPTVLAAMFPFEQEMREILKKCILAGFNKTRIFSTDSRLPLDGFS
jgi:hypothetical protein